MELTCAICFLVALPATYVGQIALHEEAHALTAQLEGAVQTSIDVWPVGHKVNGATEFGMTYATFVGDPTPLSRFFYRRSPQMMDLVLFTLIAVIRHNMDLPPCLDGFLLAWQVALAGDFMFNSMLGVVRPPNGTVDAWAGYKKGAPEWPYRVGNALAAAGMATALILTW